MSWMHFTRLRRRVVEAVRDGRDPYSPIYARGPTTRALRELTESGHIICAKNGRLLLSEKGRDLLTRYRW